MPKIVFLVLTLLIGEATAHAQVKRMTSRQDLDLGYTPITDAGLEYLTVIAFAIVGCCPTVLGTIVVLFLIACLHVHY